MLCVEICLHVDNIHLTTRWAETREKIKIVTEGHGSDPDKDRQQKSKTQIDKELIR
jgi:hypothetical protein